MKSIKQIREHLEEVNEAVDSSSDSRKLNALVRAGLFDPHRLTMLRRALNKDNIKMTRAERDALLEVLDKLLEVIVSDNSIYSRVKSGLSETELKSTDQLVEASKTDLDINSIPPIIVMKRRAIRVFPDGQKVALYYADRINKYISVPFQSIGISESVLVEKKGPNNTPVKKIPHGGTSLERAKAAYYERMKRAAQSDDDTEEKEVNKFKALKNWERVTHKAKGENDLIRTAQKGKDLHNKTADEKQKSDERKDASSWRSISQEKPSIAAGAAIAKGVTAASDAIKKRASKKQVSEGITSIATGIAKKMVSDTLDRKKKSDEKESDNRKSMDATGEKTGKETAFKGDREIEVSNSFDAAKKNQASAEDRRMERLQKAATRAMSGRSTAVSEDVISKLKLIRENRSIESFQFEDGDIEVSPLMAKNLLETYDALNPSNKKTFLEMINKDKKNFTKIINFSRKQNG